MGDEKRLAEAFETLEYLGIPLADVVNKMSYTEDDLFDAVQEKTTVLTIRIAEWVEDDEIRKIFDDRDLSVYDDFENNLREYCEDNNIEQNTTHRVEFLRASGLTELFEAALKARDWEEIHRLIMPGYEKYYPLVQVNRLTGLPMLPVDVRGELWMIMNIYDVRGGMDARELYNLVDDLWGKL